MANNSSNCLLVSIAGLDGSGKSTLAQNLLNYLHKNGVKATSFHLLRGMPGDSPFIKTIRDLKKQIPKEFLDFQDKSEEFLSSYYTFTFAHRLFTEVIPVMEDYQVIILDRYLESHCVVQKIFGADLSPYAALFSQFPKPNLAFFIDVPTDMAISRIRQRANTEVYENSEFLELCRKEYWESAEENQWIIIDGTKPEKEVLQQVLDYLPSSLITSNAVQPQFFVPPEHKDFVAASFGNEISVIFILYIISRFLLKRCST